MPVKVEINSPIFSSCQSFLSYIDEGRCSDTTLLNNKGGRATNFTAKAGSLFCRNNPFTQN
jgi:hypothetical protein